MSGISVLQKAHRLPSNPVPGTECLGCTALQQRGPSALGRAQWNPGMSPISVPKLIFVLHYLTWFIFICIWFMSLYVFICLICLHLSSYVLAKSTKDIFESEVCGWTCWSMWWYSQNPSSGSKSGDKVLKDKDTQSTCQPFFLSLVFGSIRRVITGWVRACGCTRGRVWKHRGRKVSRKCRGSLKKHNNTPIR